MSYNEEDVRRAVDALWKKAAPNGHVYDESESVGIVAKVVLDAVAEEIYERGRSEAPCQCEACWLKRNGTP